MKRSRWLSILILLCASSAYAGQSGFYYKIQPDDPALSSTEKYYTGVQREFSAPAMLHPDQSWPAIVNIRMEEPPEFADFLVPHDWISVSFAAPDGAQLAQGSYDDTADTFSATQPMLAAGLESGACPGAAGNFEVKEIAYDLEKHVVARFAADFVQRCASNASTTYGYLRYNSDIPLPEGSNLPLAIGSDAATLNAAGCFEATSMAGRTIELHAVNGASSYSYAWSGTVEAKPASTGGGCDDFRVCLGGPSLGVGTPTILRYLTGTDETLIFDLARVVSEQAKVVLTATDTDTGKIQKAYLTACVSDTTKPTITIRSPQEGAQIVGRNFIVDVSVEDSVDPTPHYYALLGIYAFEFEANKPTRIMIPEQLLGKDEPLALKFRVKAKDASFNWAEESVNVTLQHDMRK